MWEVDLDQWEVSWPITGFSRETNNLIVILQKLMGIPELIDERKSLHNWNRQISEKMFINLICNEIQTAIFLSNVSPLDDRDRRSWPILQWDRSTVEYPDCPPSLPCSCKYRDEDRAEPLRFIHLSALIQAEWVWVESEETQTTSAPLLASWDLMLENSSTTSPHFQSPR